MNLAELFESLLELPPGERNLQEALRLSGGNATLAQRALDLVAADLSAETANRTLEQTALTARPELVFGPYRTVRILGSGGMGTVYLAERTDGQFEQTVAIKVLNPHATGPLFEHRLRSERQILANLSHPNIARLLDGNVSNSGEPYLVLEYVEGHPLDAYCDNAKLPIEGRLDVFAKICEAVDFAHRNLIIHRDLKPSNILVTQDGEPKLLDFGTARLISPNTGGDATVPMMTPRYASPEQLRSQPMNTATDVFSLGVILFELLTGAWPFGDPATNPDLPLSRVTTDLEPSQPSHCINPDSALKRAATLHSLKQMLSGDLTTILWKALDPNPEQRYRSISEFSGDLQRFRSGLPILARPQTIAYRTAKFIRRNRGAVAASLLIAAAILAGIVSTVYQARVAQRRFQEVRQLATYLMFDVHSGLQRLAGSTELQRQVVERSIQYLDRLAADAGNDTSLGIEIAEAYERLGDVLGNPYRPSLGEKQRAIEMYERGLKITQRLLTAAPNARVRRADASLRIQQGAVKGFGGDAEARTTATAQAVADLRTVVALNPGDRDTRLALARALEFQASRMGDGGGVIATSDDRLIQSLFDEALDNLSFLRERLPGDSAVLRQSVQTELQLALRWGSSDPPRSIDHLRKALGWLDKLPPAEREGVDIRRQRSSILLNIGWAQGQIHQHNEAIANITEAEKLLYALSAIDPVNTSARYSLSGVYRARGLIHGYDGNRQASLADLQRAADLHAALMKTNPNNTVYRFLRGELLVRIGNLQLESARKEEASASAREGFGLLTQLASAPNATVGHLLGACRWLMETEVIALRNPAGALPFCQLAVDRTEGKDPDAWEGLATARIETGDHTGARVAAEKALALLPPVRSGEPPSRQRELLAGILKRAATR